MENAFSVAEGQGASMPFFASIVLIGSGQRACFDRCCCQGALKGAQLFGFNFFGLARFFETLPQREGGTHMGYVTVPVRRLVV